MLFIQTGWYSVHIFGKITVDTWQKVILPENNQKYWTIKEVGVGGGGWHHNHMTEGENRVKHEEFSSCKQIHVL